MKYLISGLILLSSTTFAYDYTCYSYMWNGDKDKKGTLTLKVNSNQAIATLKNEDGVKVAEKIGGKLNPKYSSRSTINYVKFGSSLIVEEALSNGGRVLNDKKLGGFVRYESREEGYSNIKFICKR